MPCELLIRATTTPENTRFKGDPQEVRDDSFLPQRPWGSKEGPPEFVILHITDASAAQIQPRMDAVVNTLTHEILVQNVNGWRIKVSVNPNIPAIYGIDKGVRNELRDLLVNDWGGEVHDYDDVNHEYATLNFPKPVMYIPENVEKTLADMQADVHDKFVNVLFRRRYRFSEADVDQVLGLGGKVDQTLSQVNAKVIDRLA